MGVADRKSRERQEREARIVATARTIAEAEGWSAVTIRRLAETIEYSQPVLYSHFENRDAIIAAVALKGFAELADALKAAATGADAGAAGLKAVAVGYLAFARAHPALYEAMFTLPTTLRFARSDTETELRAGFAAMAAVVAPVREDVEIATETFWATLHGLAELERSGRIRRAARDERVELVVNGMMLRR